MGVYLVPIRAAIIIFFVLSFFILIPWLVYSYRKYGYLSIWASIVAYSFIFYLITALFIVLLPLPATRDIQALQPPGTKHYSLIPFYFIWDIFDGSSVVLTQPATYIQILKESSFLQAVFNFLLLLPLGIYLRYFFRDNRNWKKAFGIGFALSLFYEITQITGIYGIYNAPYRIFDVDDLILNSTGALLGFVIAPAILALFPSRKEVVEKGIKIQKRSIVSPFQQLLAVFVDYAIIQLIWNFTGGLLTNSETIEFFYNLIGFFILFFFIPVFWNGKTIGTNLLRFELVSIVGSIPSWPALLKRTLALYAPVFVSAIVRLLSQMNLAIDSPLYVYQVWFTVAIVAVHFVMWSVLFLHVLYIFFKKGKRLFYFDGSASLTAKKK